MDEMLTNNKISFLNGKNLSKHEKSFEIVHKLRL